MSHCRDRSRPPRTLLIFDEREHPLTVSQVQMLLSSWFIFSPTSLFLSTWLPNSACSSFLPSSLPLLPSSLPLLPAFIYLLLPHPPSSSSSLTHPPPHPIFYFLFLSSHTPLLPPSPPPCTPTSLPPPPPPPPPSPLYLQCEEVPPHYADYTPDHKLIYKFIKTLFHAAQVSDCKEKPCIISFLCLSAAHS